MNDDEKLVPLETMPDLDETEQEKEPPAAHIVTALNRWRDVRGTRQAEVKRARTTYLTRVGEATDGILEGRERELKRKTALEQANQRRKEEQEQRRAAQTTDRKTK